MTRHGLNLPPPGERGRQFGYIMAGIGWQAHVGDLPGAAAVGWNFREQPPKAPATTAAATGTTAGLKFTGTRPGVFRRPSGPGSPVP
jgi:hypothetical protein